MELPGGTYTPAVHKLLEQAQQQARRRQSSHIEPEHLLFTLLHSTGNTACKAITSLGQDIGQLQQTLESQVPPANPTPSATTEPPALSDTSRRVLQDAIHEARHLGHAQVDTVHLLIGILYEEQTLAHQVLENAGLSLYDVRSYVLHHAASFKSRFSPHEHTRLRPSPTFFILVLVMLTSGAALYLNVGAELVTPLTLLFIVSGWVVSLCLHEFGHALAAYYGGDRAVREAGYLTLNPVKYTQVVFSIVLPLLILFLGGLGLPGGAVYVNHQALRSPGWRSFVAAAGPLGTIAFGILIILPFVFGLAPDGFMFEFGLTTQSSAFWSALAFLGFLQITALVFNLIPIPPLDGFGILEPFLPGDIADQLRKYSGLLFLLLLLILWMGGPITDAFWRETFRLADMVGIPIDLVFNGMQQFLFWR